MDTCVFYREWLILPKDQFSILTLISTNGGRFEGNLTDICHYLSLSPQSRNRNKIKKTLDKLNKDGLIDRQIEGQKNSLTITPKQTVILLPLKWVNDVTKRNYSEHVTWSQVLKLYAWILHNNGNMSTNIQIATDLGISESTVCSAKNVLKEHYEIIHVKTISEI